ALAVALWFIAPAFVWLFGAKYDGIQHVIHWLCLAVPGMALRMAAGSVLMALGKPWMRVGFELAGLVVLVIAAILLTAYFGTTGMPLALVCSEWAMAIVGMAFVTITRESAKSLKVPVA
ncbi:MAG: polysaccharide biosynthesis C-terminal domain-containing protein, partial [Gammaproteobacteria bacterium]|nr:polysaccharide biosynthesis C-terminal domain-containing protein [Gammaproteobacteria bacterium]